MEKSTVYFTDFRCSVGTSQLDKLKKLCVAAGIKNIFIGIGLFIFLWAITENFGVGCVGLLIMFTGFGQLVIYYTQDSNKKNNRER